jgi:hypothetical protein
VKLVWWACFSKVAFKFTTTPVEKSTVLCVILGNFSRDFFVHSSAPGFGFCQIPGHYTVETASQSSRRARREEIEIRFFLRPALGGFAP